MDLQSPLIFYNMGLGQDSTAIAALYVLGELPPQYYKIPKERSFFVFADTGAELQLTYRWLKEEFEPWMERHGLKLHVLRPWGKYHVCEPSPAYPNGRVMGDIIYEHMKDTQPSFPTRSSARCTTNAKGRPLSKFRNEKSLELRGIGNDRLGILVGQGKAVPNLVAIGYAADEPSRWQKSDAQHTARNWRPVYPLVELGMTRADCREVIRRAGLAVPPKSGCICCPWAPTWHFYWLMEKYPEDFARVEVMENAAIAQKLSRGEKPYYIKDDLPLREAVAAWRRRNPHITADEIERWMYERDVYRVGCKEPFESTERLLGI